MSDSGKINIELQHTIRHLCELLDLHYLNILAVAKDGEVVELGHLVNKPSDMKAANILEMQEKYRHYVNQLLVHVPLDQKLIFENELGKVVFLRNTRPVGVVQELREIPRPVTQSDLARPLSSQEKRKLVETIKEINEKDLQ